MSTAPVLIRSKRIFSSAFPHFFTFGGSDGIGGGEAAELGCEEVVLVVLWRGGGLFFVRRSIPCRSGTGLREKK